MASHLTSITSHVHNWMLFSLWLCLFVLSGVISPLLSSSILGTCQPGEFIFQCGIFLRFHTVHLVLMARILEWFAIPVSSGPCFVRTVTKLGMLLSPAPLQGLNNLKIHLVSYLCCCKACTQTTVRAMSRPVRSKVRGLLFFVSEAETRLFNFPNMVQQLRMCLPVQGLSRFGLWSGKISPAAR